MPIDTKIFIGWDVGGWNCDHNPKSRDALVILDSHRQILGHPWRGNLRSTINESKTSQHFIRNLLALCQIDTQETVSTNAILAIDTPLGFSKPLIELLTSGKTVPSIGVASENPYLHRRTEHYLFRMGLSPLSPIKDMIGSQATKGMHVLGCFAPIRERCGVWTDGKTLKAIEAYPSACKRSAAVDELRSSFYQEGVGDGETARTFVSSLEHVDLQDALTCALLAWMFVNQPETLVQPLPETDPVEGWIFVPKDGLMNDANWQGSTTAIVTPSGSAT